MSRASAKNVRAPSGMRDFPPAEYEVRARAIAAVQRVFDEAGFRPMDTPAMERLEVLTNKYGDEGEKLIFKIMRRGEHDEADPSDLALRYDLTVPLARFWAQHGGQLAQPFKRSAVGPVWRGDRPGKGRFREFLQCDIDVVGSNTAAAEADVILTISRALAALGLPDHAVQLNSRPLLLGLVAAYGIEGDVGAAVRALDKLDKIGPDGVLEELGGGTDALGEDLRAADHAAAVRARFGGELGEELDAVDRLRDLIDAGRPVARVELSPFLARGLDYYTGTTFEFTAGRGGSSVAGGGRYDELLGMFGGRDTPAVGGSIGLDRIISTMTEDAVAEAAPRVLVTVFDETLLGDSFAIAADLRAAGVRTDVWLRRAKGLGQQIGWADENGYVACVIAGPDEAREARARVKPLRGGEEETVARDGLVDHVRALVG